MTDFFSPDWVVLSRPEMFSENHTGVILTGDSFSKTGPDFFTSGFNGELDSVFRKYYRAPEIVRDNGSSTMFAEGHFPDYIESPTSVYSWTIWYSSSIVKINNQIATEGFYACHYPDHPSMNSFHFRVSNIDAIYMIFVPECNSLIYIAYI
ncbi:MAG: hypothetical protein MJ238_06695 [Bacilli bacterium]|nr:hypothetical protein [Bacilli bacterium]